MAGKTERALVAGTDNVYDIAKYRALKIVEKYNDEFPWVKLTDLQDDSNQLRRKCLRGWFDDKHNYLDHHRRMLVAIGRLKYNARRDFIDGHSTDS